MNVSSVLEQILEYIPRDVNTVKLLSRSFRFAVEKTRNPFFKIGQIVEEVISKTTNTKLKKDLGTVRSQLRGPQTFLTIEDYKDHALVIAKSFVDRLSDPSPEVKKFIDDLTKAPIFEGIGQAIELVSVIRDPSFELDMLISLTNRALSQMTLVRSKVLLENLARILKRVAAINNPEDRSRFIFSTQARLIESIPVASERSSSLVSIVDDLFKMGNVAEDETDTEVRRSNYHALDVAMRLLAKVPDETLKNSKLEAFFTIFNRQIQTVLEIANDDQTSNPYAYNSLLSSFSEAIQRIKALPIEATSIATLFLRMVGFAGIGPKEEIKNRFLSVLSETFAQMRHVFQQLPDPYLLQAIEAMKNREFPQGIQITR